MYIVIEDTKYKREIFTCKKIVNDKRMIYCSKVILLSTGLKIKLVTILKQHIKKIVKV